MNLQQFRYLREAVRQKLNLTNAARALHTSQPGVSKAIIELEQELGVSIFARHGKRILGLTPPGQQVLDSAERIMNEIDDLKKLARDYAGSPEGTLRVATTHTQARYVLPEVVQRFARRGIAAARIGSVTSGSCLSVSDGGASETIWDFAQKPLIGAGPRTRHAADVQA